MIILEAVAISGEVPLSGKVNYFIWKKTLNIPMYSRVKALIDRKGRHCRRPLR
jgi:hypothetical protein